MAEKKISIVVEAAVAGAKRKLNEVNTAVNSMANVAKIALTAIASYYGKAAIDTAISMARMAAKNLDLERSYENLATRYNLASDEILEALDRAAKGTVDKYSLMLAANKAMRLGVATSTEEFEQLMKIASVRAKEFGFTTAQAFDFIVTAIGRASPMIADNIGILLDATTTYKEYAASIGKSADELTILEQKEAIRNRILAEGLPDMEAWNEMGETASDVFQQYDAVMVELRQELGERFLPVVLELTTAMRDLLIVANEMDDPFRREQEVFAELVKDTGSMRAATIEYAKSVQLASGYLVSYEEALKVAQRAALDYRIALQGIDAGIREDIVAMRLGHKALVDTGDATQDTTAYLDALEKKTRDTARAWAKYYDSVEAENRSFTRRMEDMQFRYAQAEENAQRRRFEIIRSSQRSIDSAQATARLRAQNALDDHQAALRRMTRDHLDELADMEWDYRKKVQRLVERAPWWIRQALQKEFAERARIAATGDREALAQFDESLKERIRQIDPVYAKELDELQEHYEHQQDIEERESRQSYRDKQDDYRRSRRQQERELRQRLRELRRSLDDQLDSWRFQQAQRHESELRSMERLREEHAWQLDLIQRHLDSVLAEITRKWYASGQSWAQAFAAGVQAATTTPLNYTPIPPGYTFPGYPGFQAGAWEIPRDMAATVHKGEMIVPAGPAESIREGGGGVNVTIENLTIGAGVSQVSAKHLARELGEELGRGIRHGHGR